MANIFHILKTIINKTDDFIYFGIISLLIYYRTITYTDSLLYRTSLLILFAVIYIYICIKDKHNKLFTALYYNKILFFILVIGIIIFLDKTGYRRLLICFITLILPLFMGFKGNTNIINFKKQDKIFAYILSLLYLLAFIQSSYFIHINDYLDKYLFPYTITLIMVSITVYLLIKFIKHHTLKETIVYLVLSLVITILSTLFQLYSHYYLMIVLWAGYIFFNIKYNKYLNPFKTLIFFITAIWLIYYPFSYHSLCYFASLDPQYYYIPENGKRSITAVYNPERIKELIAEKCQKYLDKREVLLDYGQQFMDRCEKQYLDDYYDPAFYGDIEYWNNIDDEILIKKLSYTFNNGRISYDVYNYYEKDTNILLYSEKTHTIFSSFLYMLELGGDLIPIPVITTDNINLVTYD